MGTRFGSWRGLKGIPGCAASPRLCVALAEFLGLFVDTLFAHNGCLNPCHLTLERKHSTMRHTATISSLTMDGFEPFHSRESTMDESKSVLPKHHENAITRLLRYLVRFKS